VQLGDPPGQGQADAEAAERAGERLVLLREQLEGVRQELGCDALARVLDRDVDRARARRTPIVMTPGSKVNFAALPIRLASACASRSASPRT
jgi:hypothetical protein